MASDREDHLVANLTLAAGFLRGMASRLDNLSTRSLQASIPEFRKAAADCRACASGLQAALQAYDAVD
jgi:acetyl-CoA acetyltransferase